MNARLRAYLELVRAPNVFTALADALAGFLYAGGVLAGWGSAALLGGASMCLYAGGMALNDVCDAKRDAAVRPGRPIPSGRIARSSALRFSVALLAAGVALSLLVSSRSAATAGAIAGAIVLYDAVLKSTPLAPGIMGLCRALNLMLGMTAGAWQADAVHLLPFGLMWLYVTSVTFFARKEAEQSSSARLALGTIGVGAAAIGQAVLVPLLGTETWRAAAPVALGVWLVGRGWRAVGDPRPLNVQRAVMGFIFALVLLDASLVLVARGPLAAALVAALLIPTRHLGKRFAST